MFRTTVLFCLLFSSTVFSSETKPIKPLLMGFTYKNFESANIEGTDLSLKQQRFELRTPLSKFHLFDGLLIPSVEFEKLTFDLKQSGNDITAPDLYTLKLPFTFIAPKAENSNWQRIIRIAPSLHTDMDAVDSDAYSLLGTAIWNHTSDGPHSYNIGFGVNRLFGEYKPIPVVSYSYQINADSQVVVGFPITKYESRFADTWSYFVSVGPQGGNWRYENSEQVKNSLRYTGWNFQFGARKNLFGKVWVTASFGKVLSQKLDLNENTALETEVDVADTSSFRLSFGLHP